MKTPHPTMKTRNGFSLIELMIVCAVLAILASVAYPGYNEHVRKGRRADAQRALEEASQFLRRRYSSMDTHVGAQLPGTLRQTPAQGGAAYNISMIENNNPVAMLTAGHTFTLRAVRTGSMSGDRCGDLELDHTGARRLQNSAGGATLGTCFRGG